MKGIESCWIEVVPRSKAKSGITVTIMMKNVEQRIGSVSNRFMPNQPVHVASSARVQENLAAARNRFQDPIPKYVRNLVRRVNFPKFLTNVAVEEMAAELEQAVETLI